jgi:hypothetical protein
MDPGAHYIKATVHNDNDDTTYVEYLKFEFHKPEIVFTNILGENESTNLSDIIKLVRYMKSNNQGPWASN